ncbi:putative protocadherin-16 [Triplophysa rosa]|uniref:Protocadherin-16 n=1 Tax=Triplophysa rosa TaxID=992332 RepID=A0A9W7WA55_TRIRA|nr:putative protocadherin-16 [Triplophysa rosa]
MALFNGFGTNRCGQFRMWVFCKLRMLLVICVVLELVLVRGDETSGILELQLDEEQPAGTIVGDISAGLPPGVTAYLYFISDHEGTGIGDLHIDETTGIIKTARQLDRENRDHYSFIAVTMTGLTVKVSITVNDINDHAPTFSKKKATLKIPEQTAVGTKFSLDPAADADKDQLTVQGYQIKDGNVGQVFRLETKRAANKVLYLDLVVSGILDREKRSSYSLVLEAFDGGSPRKTGQMTLDVLVQDINDHAPVFNQSRYHAIISESLPQGSNILQVFATDADEGDNGLVLYEINRRQSDPDHYFVIDPRSGVITLNKPLDYEVRKVHELVVQARDNASHPEITNAFVTIHVRDFNDNQPTMTIIFLSEDGSPQISEGAQPGQYVARISVTDPDYGEYSNVNVSLEGGDGKFALTTKDSIIYLIYVDQFLDREERDSYELHVLATDSGTPPLRAESSFTIHITDENDNPPLFDQQSYKQAIPEVVYPGSFVLQVTARDKDQGPNGDVRYSILPDKKTHASWFTIDPVTGIITTATQLDYETDPKPRIKVVATDGGRPPLSSTALVEIELQDSNDNAPVFESSFYNVSIKENTAAGTCFLEVSVSKDVTYSISAGDPDGYFTVDSETGALRTSLPLDHETRPFFDLEIQACSGSPPAFGESRVRITIADVNDNAPVFFPSSSESLLLPEATKMGTVVYRVQAEDSDSGPNGQLSFDLMSAGGQRTFGVDRSSGEIRLIGTLSYDNVPRYDLQVIAKDSGAPQLSTTFTLVVHIQVENAQGPVFDTMTYRVELKENSPLNTRFLQVRALNRDPTGNGGSSKGSTQSAQLSYRLRPDGDAAGFGIAPDSGWLFVKSALDREAKDIYLLTVLATSGSGQMSKTGSATVRVSVTDENDNSPRFSQERVFLAVRENLPAGTGFGRVSATDRDAGLNSRLTYRLLHSDRHFQINSQTGEISTGALLDREHQSSYQLVVVVQDGGTPPRSATGTAHITVLDENDNAPAFSHTQPGREILIQVQEDLLAGSVIGTLHAKDPDEGENGTIFYSLLGSRAERFSLNSNTGELCTSSPLRRAEKAEYSFTVTASDRGAPSQTSSTALLIQVIGSTRTPPKPNSLSMTLNSLEGAKPGSVIGSVRSHDQREVTVNGQVTFLVMGGTDHDGTFMVDRLTGDVYLARELDYEKGARYTLQIEVDDFSKAFPSSHIVNLEINVQDSNDHAPQFPEDPVTIVIPENIQAGSSIYTFQASDKDGSGPNSEIRYSIQQRWPDNPDLFSLDPITGVLKLGRELDHEETSSLFLVVHATDSAVDPTQRLWGSVTARVFVTDENDNTPIFSSPTAVSVMEDQPVGFVLLYVMARDADQGENGRVSYRIQSGNTAGRFSLSPNSGSLSILKPLDREEQESYNLTIVAEDHGIPQHSTTQVLCINVIDVNDEAPWFESSEFEAQIRENQPAGTSILKVSASDRDHGTNGLVIYGGVTEDGFTINPETGVISATQVLDRELQDQYTITVYAKDAGIPPNFAKAKVHITVQDENDNAPAFGREHYSLEVPENLDPVELFTLKATDQDTGESGRLKYKITAGDPDVDFQLNTASGALSTSRPLDRERKSSYILEVVAQDHGSPSLSSTATVEISVLDVNDNSPKFSSSSYTIDVSEDAAVGSVVLDVTATDVDEGENGQILFFLSQEAKGAFTVDPDSGRITTTALLDREKRASYTFHVYAVDLSPAAPRNATAQVTATILDINDNAPFFIQDPLIINVSSGSVSTHQVVATMRAEDKDFGANGSVFYRFAMPVQGFAINSLTGEIQTTEKLQTLTQTQRTLIVEAMDQGSPPQSSLGVVVIYVKEQDYRGIKFSRTARDVTIQENAAKGTAVAQAQAQHPDGNRNGITYTIFSGNKYKSFSISSSTGEIWVDSSNGLDFEDTPRLRLVVKAETTSSSSFTAVNLILQDVNDNLPRFQLQNYVAYMHEAQGYDFPIIQVVAEDVDQGQNGQVTYSIESSSQSGLFKIDPVTGSITTAAIMDREIWTQAKLVIKATDRGSPKLVGTATITVIIVDLNDNSPTIPIPREVRIPENSLIGTEITLVTGNDVDSGPVLSYSLQLDASSQGKFDIHRYNGRVSLIAPLDFEERTWYTLTIRASDSKHQSEANLTVLVGDINDNAPTFTQDLYQVTLPEHSPAGSPVITVTATDRDSGENGRVTYRVVSSTREEFYIDPKNGTLFIRQRAEFDPEQTSASVVIEACDAGTPSLSSSATVQVQLIDVNDNAPIFHQLEYRATVPEDQLPGATILTLEAVDGDLSQENSGFDFAIASGNVGNAFQIESSVHFIEGHGFQTVGTLILAERLDFETLSHYNLTIAVSDRGSPQRSSSVPAIVTITDVNDNPPVFGRAEYIVALNEGAAAGTEILRVIATDPDSAPYAEVQYSISSGDEMKLFSVDQWTGALKLQRPLDRESRTSHVVIVQASDGHGHFALAPVSVEVKDINDNRPYFPIATLTTSIRENQPPNSAVTVLHAIDYDTGVYGQLKYYIMDHTGLGRDLFLVDQNSGAVLSKQTFDFEKDNSFYFIASAVDAGNNSATVTVQVYVTGEDEYDPIFTSLDFSFEVPEGANKGQSIGEVQAKDEDSGVDGIVLYSFPNISPYFDVNKTTGVIYLKMDGSGRSSGGSRSKRETRLMTMDVNAHSPLDSSRVATARLTIDITNTSFGLATDFNILLVSIIAASLGVIVLLVIIAVALYLVRSSRKKKGQDTGNSTVSSGTALQKLDEVKPTGGDRIYHQALPGYAGEDERTGGTYTRGGSLDPSHSSGRGSAEAAEDDEIRMINEYPRVASITSSMQEHISARGPDSGIQQDADQLSDISCEPGPLDASQWFKSKKLGSISGTLLSGQLPVYRDEGGGYLGVGRGLNISHPKDYGFPVDGKPSVDGSLTAIVASDEELRGSYNWDYLLNWCPQFQPLASVFTEIARLKDENLPPNNPRRPFQPKLKTDPKPRIDPPPLITSVAHPGAKSVPPKPAKSRTFHNFASLRRSPISHEGSISSAAMSPSFSPSLSPLASRSPAVSPFGVTQGPSASIISTTEHSLENTDEAEMRI